MLKEAKAHVTRVRALDQLHRGDEIEARLKVGPNYDDVIIRRGSVYASDDEGEHFTEVASHLPDVLCVRAAAVSAALLPAVTGRP